MPLGASATSNLPVSKRPSGAAQSTYAAPRCPGKPSSLLAMRTRCCSVPSAGRVGIASIRLRRVPRMVCSAYARSSDCMRTCVPCTSTTCLPMPHRLSPRRCSAAISSSCASSRAACTSASMQPWRLQRGRMHMMSCSMTSTKSSASRIAPLQRPPSDAAKSRALTRQTCSTRDACGARSCIGSLPVTRMSSSSTCSSTTARCSSS